jgi:hypothetical protein
MFRGLPSLASLKWHYAEICWRIRYAYLVGESCFNAGDDSREDDWKTAARFLLYEELERKNTWEVLEEIVKGQKPPGFEDISSALS